MDLKGNLIMNSGYSDRRFLIEFIITNYLGPDVNSHSPRCSVVQRLMTGSPPYILSDLGPSYVSISFLERLYYYLLRDAFPNLVLDLNMFHMYLKGKLILPGSDFTQDTQQFTSFFPLDLHQQIWYPDSFRVIKGVVLIDDPSTSCMIGEDLNRFRSLTGISTLKLNISECLGFQLGHPSSKKGNQMNKVPETIPNGESQLKKNHQEHKRKYVDDTTPLVPEFPYVFPTKHNAKVDPSKKTSKSDGPTLMPLLSIPDIDECSLDSSLILTGTARKGPFGPSVGVVDIGISKGAYLFRVSLPGVKKDSNQFSCDIESDGRVQIRGVLTGGRTIMKQSRIFQMNTRQLCPPGPFTLSFSLPGPVDPRLFAPNFRSDGIFEGVVVKH
ncbi:increased DNA methylation 3 isoform X2 [Cajanus cajan]|uniref:increased DNA methylation 3 isoform X2 n=1 Tax=Cajanus cajan TaxID=3821 RepID=UPI00098DAA7A|nr:increased DNA methylation 3 isoform X2 [Cajanus cajan]